MSHRDFTVGSTVLAVLALMPVVVGAQSGTPSPRTPWGQPDLQGVWDYRSITPLERPEELGDREFLTEEEAARLEQETVARNEELLVRSAERTAAGGNVDRREDGSPGFYNNFWLDRGTTTVETRRTSMIVDPPSGRLPALTEGARGRADSEEAQRIAGVRRGDLPAGSWDELDAGDRCIQHAKAGPPISVGGYNNNIQVFQTPGHVAILNEQNHDVRIVPLDGSPHVASQIGQWMGDSRGHWEGDTLVVETIRFNGKHDQVGRPLLSSGEHLSLVERFTRVDPGTMLYEFTVTDPTIWVRPWTAEMTMKKSPDLIYEFACHEGNYAMPGILTGGRLADKAAASGASDDGSR